MSGRFVRASKFRHVFGTPAKKEKQFLTVRSDATGEGNHIAGSTAYWAVALPGGGGPVLAYSNKTPARVDINAPKVNVHKAKVVDLDFSPFNENVLATASEDGTVKVTVLPPSGEFKADINKANQSLEGHTKKLSLVRWHPTANNVLSTVAYDNTVKVWDVEKGKEMYSMEDHPNFPISSEWNEDGSLLLTSCKDNVLRLFDPRKKGAVQKAPGLGGSKGQRVVWFSALGKFASIGFQPNNSRGYSIFDLKKLDAPLGNADIDSASGVLIPYYDPDNSILYLAGKGDAAIKYWEVTNDEPFIHYLSEFRDNESTKGACFLPKLACNVSSCEVAVCMRLMKEAVIPISFQVPRKSEMFQADLYPDTYAGKPVMTADEYGAGTDRAPLKRSMKPGSAAPDSKVQSSTAFSASAAAAAPAAGASAAGSAELVAQLAAANKRIAELEAEVARLKGGGSS